MLHLRVWTRDYIDRPGVRKSQLYDAIIRKFREQGVEIPDPQRDVHVRDLPAGVLTGTPGGKDGDSPREARNRGCANRRR